MDDLLDDYRYTSQPNTPGFPPAEFGAHGLSSPERPALKEGEDPEMYEVKNIRRVDANSPRSSPPILPINVASAPSKNAALDPTTPTTASFLTDVMKSWDAPKKSTSNPPPPPPPAQAPTTTPTATPSHAPTTTAPAPTDTSLEGPKSPSSPSASDMYASSSHWAQMRAQLKGKRSGSQDMSRNSSHKTGDSTIEDSNKISKSNSPAPRLSNESSRSATKPVPPNTDGRSGSFTSYTPLPKFPEPRRPSSPVIPYGRPPRPSIDIPTGIRGPSFPGSPERSGQRRGSSSDVKRPIIEIRPSTGNRSASNSPIIGSMPFSTQNDNNSNNGRPSSRNRNREEDMVGKLPVFAPREGLPDIRAGVGERIGRPQSPARGVSPSSQQTRPQSPVRGISPARSIPLPPPDKASRTPSPLKPVPVSKNTAIPNQIEAPPKPVTAPVVTPSPPPPPFTQTSQPLSPRPDKKVTLPEIPQISIPPPIHPQIDRTSSPSPDTEWKDSEADESKALPPDKRTTVFLQEAGKRKESLPPLPTEPAPPLPESFAKDEWPPPSLPTQPTPPLYQSSPPEDPVERLRKQLENPSNPLILPPAAPVVESRQTGTATDSNIEPSHQPETELAAKQVAFAPERPRTPVDNPPPVPSALSGDVESSQIRLPELDVLRPITWGPLTFASLKDAKKSDGDKSDEVAVVDKSEDVEEESDWEKVDEDEAREETSALMTIREAPHEYLEGRQTGEPAVQGHTESRAVLMEFTGSQQSSHPDDNSMETRDVDPSMGPQETVSSVRQPPSEIHEAIDARDVSEEHMEATAPPESTSDHDSSIQHLDKGKNNEVDLEEHIPNTEAMSSDGHTDPESTFRSKYIDRDITSFINPEHVNMSRNDERLEPAREAVPSLRTRTIPEEPSMEPFSFEYLPAFMLGKDIPEMSTVAQRIGAYQSRRDQMIKADTGLRGWLLQVQHSIPNLPQRITIPLTLLIVAPPEIKRLSRESHPPPPVSPSTPTSPFANSGKAGRKVISKMKIGGKRLGAASKNTLAISPTDKRSSREFHYGRQSSEVVSPTLQQRSSPEVRSEVSTPVVSRSEGLPQAEFRSSTQEQGDIPMSHNYPDESQPVRLGLSTSSQPYSPEANPPPTPFAQMHISTERSQSPVSYPSPIRRPETPNTPTSPGQVMSRKEGKAGGRHGYSSSLSGGGSVARLFGQTSESKAKHHSDSTDYPAQTSPKQKSKFSRFVSDISQTTLTGSKPGQSAVKASPPPPPPPDKSQFRAPSEGSGKVKGFFADLSSRDVTGSRPSDRQQVSSPRLTSPRAPKTSPRTGGDERSGTGGFSRFFSDLSRRDITGQTEEDRAAAARRRQQEATHIPAQPVVYDENASDWEDKMATMEDVLPHIRRELLVESLKQSGGDEQRAIGLAVIRSRGL